MFGRVYTVSFDNVTVSASQDFFEITPADDKPVELMALFLSNVGGTADAADAQEEILRWSIVQGHTTSGSGGSTPTPRPISSIDTAAGFSAEANNTTIASTAGVTIHADGWNTRIPLQVYWPDGMRPGASQANTTIVVRLLSTPADGFAVSGTLYVRELY